MRGSYGGETRASSSPIAALAITLLLLACGQAEEAPPASVPEEHIVVLLPDLINAVQAKQPVFVMEHVSTGFKEERGLDYFGVRSLVESYAFRDDRIGARLESVSVTAAESGQQRVVARVSFALGHRLADGARWQAVGGSYRRE